ncbi:cation transporter [Novacetimonas hansenii]|uniref:Cobalt transporter n=2 Tax=Novacetimonas hansenii TaxID=436 RepID=A0ABQ0SEI6_NOVHA|nr:cation diffusion facilitator family transporter [Novacetimonas hansenii]EFG85285.1 cation diffusion facilitator family transporter [Novacetimonas hansenii ATCC 23769]MBL7235841.1 cation transporter [Novacetimonas hansenii]PYD72536.1 cation transporter [Novacetimonas hansenii]QOF94852.1 cation transporter [Novacetimonas hansenii]WEQ57697.1 cation diffusion facilitator family transporter [Novacetimonas hansenii]
MGDEHHDESCHGHGHDHSPHHDDGHGHSHDHDEEDGHAGHDHAHGAFGHHHAHAPASYGRAFAFGIALNLIYVIAEATWGVASHALALLADAGHNLSDVLALGAAWLAEILSRRSPTANFTYGLRRSSILAALGNAVALLLVTGGIIWESVLRLAHPHPVAGMTVMVVAAIGIAVNGVTAMLFASGGKGDLNLRGAFLHMASDALMSLAVVVSGGIIVMTGWLWMDPVVSLLVSISIVAGTWSLLRDSLDMALDRVPRSVDRMQVEEYLRTLPDIVDLHDLHIWPISTTETALTVHLVRDEHAPAMNSRTLHDIARELKARFRIVHPTLQMETRHDATLCMLAAAHSV